MRTDHSTFFQRVDEAAQFLESRIAVKPRVAVVLTGGIGGFADRFDDRREVSFEDIPHFVQARAEGHAGTIAFGRLHGIDVAAMHGRFHYYEGHRPMDVVFPHVVLGTLGIRALINTNAVGGIRSDLNPGDIMLVTDHLNMMGINPLIGLATQREEDQFTSMIDAYDPKLLELARRVARSQNVRLKEGVFAAVTGPSYETRSEVKALRTLGADAVGMSTVPEVIAARFLDIKVLALSCIANPAADRHGGAMTHEEVLEAMNATAPQMIDLLDGIIAEIGSALT